MARARSTLAAVALIATGCMQFSPFETDLRDSEQNRTAHNLARLSARPEPGRFFQVAVIADNHDDWDDFAAVVDELNRRDLELVIHLGDLGDFGLRHEYRWSLEQLERLSVPYFTTVGNHDALSNGDDIYPNMFGPYDYTFEHGGVRFVLFNSNTLEFGASTPNSDWLRDNTRAPPGTRVMAFAHQRPNEAVPHYENILAENAVELLATGHLHRTERSELDGIRALSVGSTMSRDWVLITIAPDSIGVESCTGDRCQPLLP